MTHWTQQLNKKQVTRHLCNYSSKAKGYSNGPHFYEYIFIFLSGYDISVKQFCITFKYVASNFTVKMVAYILYIFKHIVKISFSLIVEIKWRRMNCFICTCVITQQNAVKCLMINICLLLSVTQAIFVRASIGESNSNTCMCWSVSYKQNRNIVN